MGRVSALFLRGPGCSTSLLRWDVRHYSPLNLGVSGCRVELSTTTRIGKDVIGLLLDGRGKFRQHLFRRESKPYPFNGSSLTFLPRSSRGGYVGTLSVYLSVCVRVRVCVRARGVV